MKQADIKRIEDRVQKDIEIWKNSPKHYSNNPLDDIDWDEDEEQYMFDIPADEFMKGV